MQTRRLNEHAMSYVETSKIWDDAAVLLESRNINPEVGFKRRDNPFSVSFWPGKDELGRSLRNEVY